MYLIFVKCQWAVLNEKFHIIAKWCNFCSFIEENQKDSVLGSAEIGLISTAGIASPKQPIEYLLPCWHHAQYICICLYIQGKASWMAGSFKQWWCGVAWFGLAWHGSTMVAVSSALFSLCAVQVNSHYLNPCGFTFYLCFFPPQRGRGGSEWLWGA